MEQAMFKPEGVDCPDPTGDWCDRIARVVEGPLVWPGDVSGCVGGSELPDYFREMLGFDIESVVGQSDSRRRQGCALEDRRQRVADWTAQQYEPGGMSLRRH
jgi:hypothetical protein